MLDTEARKGEVLVVGSGSFNLATVQMVQDRLRRKAARTEHRDRFPAMTLVNSQDEGAVPRRDYKIAIIEVIGDISIKQWPAQEDIREEYPSCEIVVVERCGHLSYPLGIRPQPITADTRYCSNLDEAIQYAWGDVLS